MVSVPSKVVRPALRFERYPEAEVESEAEVDDFFRILGGADSEDVVDDTVAWRYGERLDGDDSGEVGMYESLSLVSASWRR